MRGNIGFLSSEGKENSLCVASQSGFSPPYYPEPFVYGASEDCFPTLAPFWINIYRLGKSLLYLSERLLEKPFFLLKVKTKN